MTSTAYLPSFGGPATTVTVTTPPPSGTGAGFTTTVAMDVRWSAPVTISDPNGRITRAEYDAGGRLLKVWKNHRAASGTNGVTPDIEYSYVLRDNGPNYVSTKTLTHTGAQLESFTAFDGLLRLRRSETIAATGSGRTVADTRYDTVGNVDKKLTYFNTSSPNPNLDYYSETDVPSLRRFLYDNQGRVLRDQLLPGSGPDLIWETIYAYDGDKTITMQPPAGGTATTTVNDARDHTVELRQHLGGTPAGAVDVTTKYTYDRLGQLTQVADTANNTWTYTYDLLGRKVSTVDPDAGTSTSKFDDAGQLLETVDANNNKLAYKYDLLGRKTEVRETSLTGDIRASWTYDTAVFADGVIPAKGQLASTSRFDAGNTYTSTIGKYDDAYRAIETTDTVPGFAAPTGTLTYTATNAFHANGTLDTRDVPAVGGLPQEKITYTYHSSTGLPNAVTSNVNSGTTYVASTNYFHDGKPDTVILGGTGKRVKQTSTFDAATRRLTNTATATETTTVGIYSAKLSDTYTYDNAGNITSIAGQTNGAADQEECFTYDHLQRLTEAWTQTWTSTPGACTTPQRTGADPYRRQWPTLGGYDKLGNRLTQIDKDTTDTTWNYTIGGVDSCGGTSKPHAVTTITATGPKAGTPTRSFCYDQAGNTTQRTTDTGVVQTLTWDKDGHLATLADGTLTTSYIYDSSGRRLIASNADKSTLYLPDGTELEKASNGTIFGQRYYGVAVRDTAGPKWIISNHQETGTAQVDSVTLTVNRRRSMPFGEARGTQPSWLGTKGYVGGTKDATGLTHLGAREYDPTTGRFISVDPIMDMADPQQWNAYTYSNNSPVTYSDPDGRVLQWLMDGGGGPPGGGALAIGVSSANIAALSIAVAVVTTADDYIEDQLRDDERDAQNKTGNGPFSTGQTDRDGKSIWSDGSIRDKTGKIIYPAGTLDMNGPGTWRFKNEGMNDNPRNWQSKVTGAPPGLVYELNDYDFDGYRDGMLYDAKGHHSFMIKDGEWKSDFAHNKDKFLETAERQRAAADGEQVVWVFLEREVADRVRADLRRAGFNDTEISVISPTL